MIEERPEDVMERRGQPLVRVVRTSGVAVVLVLAAPLALLAADTTPPSAVTVTDGGASTSSTSQLSATWTASSDPEQPTGVLLQYEYQIRKDSPTGPIISPVAPATFTLAGTATQVTKGGLSLVKGARYWIGVRAKNQAGLYSTVSFSDGIAIAYSGTLTTNTTWALAASPIYVSSTVNVSHTSTPTLTIEPGVEVRFYANTGLTIGAGSNSGILKAQGQPPSRFASPLTTPHQGLGSGTGCGSSCRPRPRNWTTASSSTAGRGVMTRTSSSRPPGRRFATARSSTATAEGSWCLVPTQPPRCRKIPLRKPRATRWC